MTHLISEISIKNYKSIIDETFDLSPFTPLVGYNNAGKSNMLEAIKWFLRSNTLTESDFNDVKKPVEVIARIDGVSEDIINSLEAKHKKKIEKFVIDTSMTVKVSQEEPNQKRTDIKTDLLNADGEWEINPNGIQQAITALFPEPIHVGAMENSEEDASKNKTSTTIGKLLKDTLEPLETKYSAEVIEALKGINDQLTSEGANRAPELDDFDKGVNSKITEFFPGVEIKVHIPNPEIKEVFGKGTVKVFENKAGEGRDFSSLGHGAQRSIQMALVRHLADVKRVAASKYSNTLLLIDEPELYLHPQAAIILKEALKTLSKSGYQVIFSTHSPFMISKEDMENTILIRKNKEKGTYKRITIKTAIKDLKIDALSQIELLHEFSNSANIFFADKVILTEGKTEKRVLPNIIESITEKSLGAQKIALVSLEGASSLKRTQDVLKALDLPNKGVVDLDFAITKYKEHKLFDKTHDSIKAINDYLATKVEDWGFKITEDGWPTNKGSIRADEVFAKLAQTPEMNEHVEVIIRICKEADIWVWRNGTIESHIGLESKKKGEHQWKQFNSDVNAKGLKETVDQELFNQLKNAVEWLTE
ncbi:MAG: AAA family ATPase [Bacteroidales bacterium]|jgi:putative ATP-dependent endonuclease of OLD family|nr:AAA family ATPase [Bacteroidales bacterium]